MPRKAMKDFFMLNNLLKLNFMQKINLFLRLDEFLEGKNIIKLTF